MAIGSTRRACAMSAGQLAAGEWEKGGRGHRWDRRQPLLQKVSQMINESRMQRIPR